MGRINPETAICNRCYKDWYNNSGKHHQEMAQRAFRGVSSYKEAADKEEGYLPVLEAAIVKGLTSGDGGSVRFFSKQKLFLQFRVRVLREVLAENEPVTFDYLGQVLLEMINVADLEGEILGTANTERKIQKWVDKELDLVAATTPIGRSASTVIQDCRKHPALLYPYIHNMHQVESIVANFNEAVEREKVKVQQLKEEVAFLKEVKWGWEAG